MMIYPMFAMFLLSVVALMLGLKARVRAVRSGDLKFKYFRTLSGEEAPDYVIKPTRNFSNLFEAPVLFYVACLAAMILKIDNQWMVGLAWTYFFTRAVHTSIHIGYNNIKHRMWAYIFSWLVLTLMWGYLVIHAA